MSEYKDTEIDNTEVFDDEDYSNDETSVASNEDILNEEDNSSINDDFNELTEIQVVPKDQRKTRPFLTKYELVRIIGTRRKQLSLGAKPMIKVEGKLSINEIVDEEIKNNMIPFKIRRPLPDSNKVEIWEFEELEKSHLIN